MGASDEAKAGMAEAALRPGVWRRALGALRQPVPEEKRRLLAARWSDLDPRWRTPAQGFGQQAAGCGATLGTNPRCDFDCQGCYLGRDANAADRFSPAEVRRQLLALRRWLGPKGNLQITDGEVTLLPAGELVEIVRSARELGMIPMLMTHGDTFRRRPELLTRLVREGGLSEVSFHVDTTQRGRRGVAPARREEELHPVRDELAELVRTVRRETGVRLRAATTVTVTRDNLDGVGAVVAWCLAHRDVFGVVSFQPLAAVGRTRSHLAGVTADELWARVGAALAPYGFAPDGRGPLAFGHPQCSRIQPMLVYQRRGGPPRPLPVARPGHADDLALVAEYIGHGLGGLNFRDDRLIERLARGLGAGLKAPGWWAGRVRRWAAGRAAALGTSLPRLAYDLVRGAARLDGFSVASHHFMNPAELATESGRERLAACVFRVPLGDRMVPMCEVNATGLREAAYAAGSAARLPVLAAEPAAVEVAAEPLAELAGARAAGG